MKLKTLYILVPIILALLFACTNENADKSQSKTKADETAVSNMSDIEKYRKKREQMKNDPKRKLIMDNDGGDIVYNTGGVTTQAALASRFYPLKDTFVDTVFYTPVSSGVSLFTHNTKKGQVFDCTESGYKNNKAGLLIEAGIDYLTGMVDFCHNNGMELFFGMRMNDTHDNQGSWYGPIKWKENDFKVNNIDLLVGPKGTNPKYGVWTAVDYTHQVIRDMALSYLQEACQNYDIDGIHLDFFRHLRCGKR